MARRKQKNIKQKQEDETLVDITEVQEQAQDFFEKYQLPILGGLLVVVLIFGGTFGYKNFYQQPRQVEALSQMYQAEFKFKRDSFASALTSPGAGHAGFLDIIDNYKGTPAANLANYYAGVCYLNLGQYDAAVAYLEDYSPSGQVTPTMKYGTLADAYSEQENFDKAMSYYKKAANNSDNDLLTPYYLMKVGLLSERQGDKQAALKAYTKIKKEYPTSTDGRTIDKYIERLKAQG